MFKLVVTCSGFAATEQDFIQNQETFDLSCATEIEDYEEYPNEENHYTGIQTFTHCVKYDEKIALFGFYVDALMFTQTLKERGVQYTLSKVA